MGDHNTDNAPLANPREALARLLDTSYTNIAWAIRNGPEYPKDLDVAGTFQQLSTCAAFLTSIESGLQAVYSEGQAMKSQFEKAQHRINSLETLEPRVKQYEQQASAYTETIQSLSSQITTLTQTIADRNPTTSSPLLTEPRRKKREAKDPTPFDGKGSPIEKQEKFETWETKIQGVFRRDAKCFETPMDEILYMSDMLTDKAYDYIKNGLDMLRIHPNDPSKWTFSDRESMFTYMRRHYKTMDTTQVAKNKLDTLYQGERNYWSWKAELDELMIKANKTEEQKVDLLKKNVSSKIKDLALTLSRKIGDADYKGWSEQMDVFAHNLQNHAHHTKLNTAKPSTAGGYRPVSPQNDPMDLDAVKFGGGSGGLPDDVRRHRMNNRLCMACGEPGHWKDAHDPNMNPNPLPMPRRQPLPSRGGFFSRGDGNRGGNRGRGRGFGHRNPPPRFPSPTQPQPMVPYANYGQALRVTTNRETGHVIGEVPPSIYTPSETDTSGHTSQDHSHQPSPTIQPLKGQPLD